MAVEDAGAGPHREQPGGERHRDKAAPMADDGHIDTQ